MESNWFIALPFPPAALPEREFERLPVDTRAFDPADLHVTVAFLGAVGEQRALRAWARFGNERVPALRTTVTRRAVFGPPRRPSALGLELDGENSEAPLPRFIAEWRDALRDAAGLDADPRPIRAHVTLARPPRRTDAQWERALAEWLHRPAINTAAYLDRIALYTRAEPGDRRRFREVRDRAC